MTSLVDVRAYQFLQNICPFSAARHPLSATRPTAWWMELMDMAACPTPALLNWHIKERKGDRETLRQRDERENLDSCPHLPRQQASKGQNHEGSSISIQTGTIVSPLKNQKPPQLNIPAVKYSKLGTSNNFTSLSERICICFKMYTSSCLLETRCGE